MRTIPGFVGGFGRDRILIATDATHASRGRRFVDDKSYLRPPFLQASIIIGLPPHKQQDCRCSTAAKLLQYRAAGPIGPPTEPIREALYKTDRQTMNRSRTRIATHVIWIGFVASATLTTSVTGCRTSPGPWSGQAYETPTAGSPARRTVMTPGAPSPFEQTLPAGNAPTNSAMGSSTR